MQRITRPMINLKAAFIILNLFAVTCLAADAEREPTTHDLAAKDTFTAAEMNHGDTLRFQLRNGQTRTFILKEISAHIIEQGRGGIVYSFDCQFLADGQPLTLRRYVCIIRL